MEEYIKEVKADLYCNTTKEYSSKYVTYLYTDKQIDDNISYFEICYKNGLSAYKALELFDDYLKGQLLKFKN